MKKVYPVPDHGVQLKGFWTAEVRGPDGQLKQVVQGQNVVCTNGKEWLASLLMSAAITASTNTMKYIAIGTDSTAEAAANTALGIEAARHTGTVSYLSNQIYQVKATFATGLGTGAIVEYGLFSSSTGGTMLCRDTESVITKGANDTLTVTCQVTLS
jgi:hypothetical protein